MRMSLNHHSSLCSLTAATSHAYIEAPMTLGDVINQSNMITILRVKSVDKPKNMIVYDKVEDIRGKFPTAIGATRHHRPAPRGRSQDRPRMGRAGQDRDLLRQGRGLRDVHRQLLVPDLQERRRPLWHEPRRAVSLAHPTPARRIACRRSCAASSKAAR